MRKTLSLICIILLLLLSSCSFTSGKYYDNGMKSLDLKDYKEAESQFNQAIQNGYTDNNINVLYVIVNKYNTAKNEFENKEFEKARETLDEIPNLYTEYSIKLDVEALKEKIDKYEENYEKLNKAKLLFEQDKYSDANVMILSIDEEQLTEGQATDLKRLKTEINLKQKNESSNYIQKINNLFDTYIVGLCRAVNDNNFKSLQGVLYPGSDIYNEDKKYIADVGPQDLWLYSEDYSVNSINWVTEQDCVVTTVETYTIWDRDDCRLQTFKYTYNVTETSDGQLFITKISKS